MQKLNENIDTAVFVDYECWFWALKNKGESPDLEQFLARIKRRGSLKKIVFFADFTKEKMSQELVRLRTITSDIIDCSDQFRRKDFTDFIMLDHIYRAVISHPAIKQYILVTGDGHFHSVVSYLKTYQDKIVGVIGVEQTLSKQLRDCSSWYEVIETTTDITRYYPVILDSIQLLESQGIKPGFKKTSENISRIKKIDQDIIQATLRELIIKNYIKQEAQLNSNGELLRVLKTDWDLLRKKGIWKG